MLKPTTDLGAILTTIILVTAIIGACVSFNNSIQADIAKAVAIKCKCNEMIVKENLCIK